MLSLLLARQIAILYLIAAVTIVMVKAGILRAQDSRALSSCMLYFVLPCVIFGAFQTENSEWVRRGFALSVAVAVLMHGIALAAAEFIGRIMKLDEIEKASLIYTNCGTLIAPVVGAVFGQEWVIFLSAFMMVQMVFYWSHGLTLMSGKRGIDLRKIILNPNVLSALAGTAMLYAQVRLPSVLREAVLMVSGAAGPLAMINMGMIFASLNWAEIFSRKRTWQFLAVKMLILPCALALLAKGIGALRLAENSGMIVMITVLPFASATATMVAQLAQVLGRDERYAGAINAATTVCAIVTVPLVVWLFGV